MISPQERRSGQYLVLFLLASVALSSFASAASNSSEHHLRVSGKDDDVHDALSKLIERVQSLEKSRSELEARVETLETTVGHQATTIQDLQGNLEKAETLHRFLQSSSQDCLPTFEDTEFGPRCDFKYVTRFQNRTFFNDYVVFNDNVMFDSDADCMPRYNSTLRQCYLQNNFTFHSGKVDFDHDVRFRDYVQFDDEVKFRDYARFEDGGHVVVEKPMYIKEDLYVRNDDHEIDFKVEKKVKVVFDQRPRMKVNTETHFTKDVKISDDWRRRLDANESRPERTRRLNGGGPDLYIEGNLEVDGDTDVEDLDVHGYLNVAGETRLNSRMKANYGATIKAGLIVETGKLEVSIGGARIVGDVVIDGNLQLNGNLETTGAKIFSGDVEIKGYAIVRGLLTADGGAVINTESLTNRALKVNGKGEVAGDFDVTNRLKAATAIIEGGAAPLLTVKGDAKVNGILEAQQFVEFDSSTPVPGVIDVDIDKLLLILQTKTIIVENIFIGDDEVLTASKMENMDMTCNSLTANSAVIGGEILPSDGTDSPGTTITQAEIVSMLNGAELTVDSLTAKSMSMMDSSGSTIGVASIDDAKSCSCDAADINPILGELGISTDSASTGVAAEPSCSCSSGDIVNALKDTSLDVSSVRASSFTKVNSDGTSTSLATTDDVGQAATSSGGGDCTCTSEQIQSGVTVDFIRNLGFQTSDALGCTCSSDDLQSIVSSLGLGQQAECSCEPAECTCDDSQIESVVSSVISGYGFVDSSEVSSIVSSECTCEGRK